MENKAACRKCFETEDGIRGFLLECCRCGSWIHPGCHKPNVSVGAIRAMIRVSDRIQGAPGSLEAWSCRDCSQDIDSVTQKTAQTIDLTLDSDEDDGIRVVEQAPQRVKRENREVVRESDRMEITQSSGTGSRPPAFEFYAPPPYLDTLIKSRESTAKAYLTSLFPPNHTRSDYNALFDTNANQLDNPFGRWIHPEPVRIIPISKTQRHGRKPLARHAPSPSTSQLQETSWISWEAS